MNELHVAFGKVAMFKVQPDAVEAVVSGVSDEARYEMSKGTHADRFVIPESCQCLTLSHAKGSLLLQMMKEGGEMENTVQETFDSKAGSPSFARGNTRLPMQPVTMLTVIAAGAIH